MEFNYCPRCGHKLESGVKTRPACGACGYIHYRNPAVGVAVVVIADKKILLGRRKGSYHGRWCIPCGYVEWDEEVREAAIREFKEETGLEVAITGICAVHSNCHDRERQTVGIWFFGRVTGGRLKAGDDLWEAAFFPYGKVPELAFPTDRTVIEDLKRAGCL